MNPWIWWLLVAIACVALACVSATFAYLFKLRRRFKGDGSFLASYRASAGDGWTEGFCSYEATALSWYKLVSLSMRPHKTWSRSGMSLGHATRRTDNEGTVWIAVPVTADGHRFFLFLSEADYNGLISWCEAAPPARPTTGVTYSLD
ncbi:DUF2550 domain-containing protein [Nanchangia anserum]|uniref:DUF2550 domain-containing protein n=1 Tax=Nanchangia anserum TaxID=2692125 RepID=A0A8I0KQF4_9ACTO|nr:DUF2550 family protein [Nanchangia anserum]MBD3689930.1 DUF2550 domain-containing protein [Nanchangia anserum]QOX82255.1 DUF2550 domain-containing protein [Nanchangia anserum]